MMKPKNITHSYKPVVIKKDITNNRNHSEIKSHKSVNQEKVREDNVPMGKTSLKSLENESNLLEKWLQRIQIISRVTGERRLTIRDYSDLKDMIKIIKLNKKAEVLKAIDKWYHLYFKPFTEPGTFIYQCEVLELKSKIEEVFE